MRILIDENLPYVLKNCLNDFENVFTIKDMNWLGKRNGELMKLINENNFAVFITADKNLRYQQNLNSINFSIIALRTFDTSIESVNAVLPQLVSLLENINLNPQREKIYEIIQT
jgi:predicted nuclease of predicted toxin-antitoxin system